MSATTEDRPQMELSAYAETGVPVYLLIDRDCGAVVVHSEAEDGRYGSVASLAYGHTVELPGLGITLATEALKGYTR